MSEKDGGPAFPAESEPWQAGMSLRDWFAGQALTLISGRSWDHVGVGDELIAQWAETAYAIADAMLKERNR